MDNNIKLFESELKAINDEIYLSVKAILTNQADTTEMSATKIITVMIDDFEILALSPEILVLRPNVLDLIENCEIDETELASIFKICVRNFKSAFKKECN